MSPQLAGVNRGVTCRATAKFLENGAGSTAPPSSPHHIIEELPNKSRLENQSSQMKDLVDWEVSVQISLQKFDLNGHFTRSLHIQIALTSLFLKRLIIT